MLIPCILLVEVFHKVKRAGVYSVFGIITGSLVHTLFVAFGLSLILTKSIVLFNTIKIIGVIYLVYLGIKMILDKSNIGSETSSSKLNLKKFIYKVF